MPVLIVFGVAFLLVLLLDTTDDDIDSLWPFGRWSATILLIIAICVCCYALGEYL